MDLATKRDLEIAALGVPARQHDICRSILTALSYSDLFDYPLTLEEIVRYQDGTSFAAAEIAEALETCPHLLAGVARHGRMYSLAGREPVFATRLARQEASRSIWRRARAYAAVVARLPFVRMVAVTGALAVNNVGPAADIDLLVVTTPGRLWVARRLIIGVVRGARLLGDDLCPNYILSTNKLALDQQDLFTAHELAQMVPLYGERAYRAMLRDNGWALGYLPEGFPPAVGGVKRVTAGPLRSLVEHALSSASFERWEAWEMRRLRDRLRDAIGERAEVVCSPEQCKGHTGLHRDRINRRYQARLEELGLS